MNKPSNTVKNIINGAIIAGIIILLIGLYYWIIKAGIPYQDPTEELRIQYAVNMGIGDELVKTGAVNHQGCHRECPLSGQIQHSEEGDLPFFGKFLCNIPKNNN